MAQFDRLIKIYFRRFNQLLSLIKVESKLAIESTKHIVLMLVLINAMLMVLLGSIFVWVATIVFHFYESVILSASVAILFELIIFCLLIVVLKYLLSLTKFKSTRQQLNISKQQTRES